MKRFIAATRNRGKIEEIRQVLSGLQIDVIPTEEAGICNDIEETGGTFEENALIKARKVSGITGQIVIADDSGLEVDFLDGAPGIYSSRFAGEGASDTEKNDKLLGLLKDVPFEKRTARFVCAIAVVFPDGKSFTVRAECEGYIGFKPEGTNGFGYDPLFYVPEFGKTIAQMEPEVKNKISHRGKALELMVDKLKKQL